MLRGHVDVAEVEAWLAEQGWDWLRLRDNGVLSAARTGPGWTPGPTPHVYHLMPDGLSKGAAVGWDLARRGLSAARRGRGRRQRQRPGDGPARRADVGDRERRGGGAHAAAAGGGPGRR